MPHRRAKAELREVGQKAFAEDDSCSQTRASTANAQPIEYTTEVSSHRLHQSSRSSRRLYRLEDPLSIEIPKSGPLSFLVFPATPAVSTLQ
jgi:hypothetical protein